MPAIPGFKPPVKALCVAPQGLEEGSTVELPDDELAVVVGETSEFRFFAAANRKDDRSGTLIDADSEGLAELDPVEKQVEAAICVTSTSYALAKAIGVEPRAMLWSDFGLNFYSNNIVTRPDVLQKDAALCQGITEVDEQAIA